MNHRIGRRARAARRVRARWPVRRGPPRLQRAPAHVRTVPGGARPGVGRCPGCSTWPDPRAVPTWPTARPPCPTPLMTEPDDAHVTTLLGEVARRRRRRRALALGPRGCGSGDLLRGWRVARSGADGDRARRRCRRRTSWRPRSRAAPCGRHRARDARVGHAARHRLRGHAHQRRARPLGHRRKGKATTAASWRATAAGYSRVTGATALRPNEIQALEVRTGTGKVLASART